MVDLIEAPAAADLPITIGEAVLEICPVSKVTWLAVLPGRREAVSNALTSAHDIGFPSPDKIEVAGNVRAIWVGHDEALIWGAVPDVAGAVTTDMSDGIACLRICGGAAREVMMRLTPLDLRDAHFGVGASARTMLGHLNVSLLRTDTDVFEVIVARSMTRTAIQDLTRAMKMLG